jgi:hypothetical protein
LDYVGVPRKPIFTILNEFHHIDAESEMVIKISKLGIFIRAPSPSLTRELPRFLKQQVRHHNPELRSKSGSLIEAETNVTVGNKYVKIQL